MIGSVIDVALRKANRIMLWISLTLRKWSGSAFAYQPDPFAQVGGQAGRDCSDRLSAIEQALGNTGSLSSLDIGCNNGYFTFAMAQRGGVCLGLDVHRPSIEVAQDTARIHGIDNAIFACMDIVKLPDEGIPDVDVSICLAVYHHLARRYGEESANGVMAKLAAKTRRCMIFETGHPREKSEWADALAFMGEDHDGYTIRMLKKAGFSNVRVIGTFPTSVSEVPRSLFLAERD